MHVHVIVVQNKKAGSIILLCMLLNFFINWNGFLWFTGGPSSSVSWNHIFVSLNQYYSSLRRETPTSSEVSQRAPHIRGITLKELEGLISVLRLANVIAEKVNTVVIITELMSVLINTVFLKNYDKLNWCVWSQQFRN